jgi:hypothetical protein
MMEKSGEGGLIGKIAGSTGIWGIECVSWFAKLRWALAARKRETIGV